jgi:hypothetical protein
MALKFGHDKFPTKRQFMKDKCLTIAWNCDSPGIASSGELTGQKGQDDFARRHGKTDAVSGGSQSRLEDQPSKNSSSARLAAFGGAKLTIRVSQLSYFDFYENPEYATNTDHQWA